MTLVPPSPQTPKTLFRFQLWRPAYLRHHATSSSSCQHQPCQPPRLSSSIRIATLNVHSLRKKYVPVSDFIQSSELDVLVLVESWHNFSADVAELVRLASTSSTVRGTMAPLRL